MSTAPAGDASRRSTVLVVDDDKDVAAMIEYIFQKEGFTVLVAHDGATALNLLSRRGVDAVALDVVMPVLDGLTVCERIKARSDIPVMLVSGLAQSEDVIRGLEQGADDYVTKPFHPRVLALRLRRLVRWAHGNGDHAMIRVGEMVIDTTSRTVTMAGRRVELPQIQFRLLAHLAEHRGRPQTWRVLLHAGWGPRETIGGCDRDMVKTTIRRLRGQLEPFGARHYIATIRGEGYMMPDLSPDESGAPGEQRW